MKYNILIILVSVTILYLLWERGLEKGYSLMIKNGISICYSYDKNIKAELKEENEKLFFYLYYDNTGWREPTETIVLPFIVLLAWQILVLFHVPLIKGLKIGGRNILFFYIFQVLFMLLLYGMNTSQLAIFLFRLLKNSFGIVILFIIIFDIYSLGISLKNNPKIQTS